MPPTRFLASRFTSSRPHSIAASLTLKNTAPNSVVPRLRVGRASYPSLPKSVPGNLIRRSPAVQGCLALISLAQATPRTPLFRLHAALRVLLGMHHAIARATVRPHQQQNVFVLRHSVNLAHEVIGVRDRMTIHFENHVAGSEARIVGRATGAHFSDGRA